MKITYLHQYFLTPGMSGGTRSYEMARRMVTAGHEVNMVTSYCEQDAGRKGWFKTKEAGINVYWYPVRYSNHMSFQQRIKAFYSFALAASKKLLELDGDIVYATSTPLTIAIPAVFSARIHKIPMVFEVRDLWPDMPIAMGVLNNPVLKYAAHQLERWAYRNSAAVVALSPGMKDGVVNTGYPADQVAVIPNSSDNQELQYDAAAAQAFRDKRPWLGDKPLLVYAGTFGKVNGVGYVVDLAAELKRIGSDIRILLVGDGRERAEIIQAAKDARVFEGNLFFESKVPKKEVFALLSAATMASNLVIDLHEARANSANKFFDSLASGTPIFLNHGGWMHELVKKHGCGLALWQEPIEQVALELENKMHDSLWLESAGFAARKLAEKEFDRDKLAGQLVEILEEVVQANSNKVSSIAPGEYV